MQNFDGLTLVFLGLAIFVIYKLRGVLGQRIEIERPAQDAAMPSRREGGESPLEAGGNVVPMRGAQTAVLEPEARLAGIVPKESPAFPGLVAIMGADSSFDPAEFLVGAKAAYEMIVLAFAQGDRETLKPLLAKEVYDGFESAITDRESRAEKVETQFVSIDKAELFDALLRVRLAQVTVKFASKIITATRDANGTVIDGSAEKTVDVTDIWTFSRDISSRDPNWRLIATESTH